MQVLFGVKLLRGTFTSVHMSYVLGFLLRGVITKHSNVIGGGGGGGGGGRYT